MAFSAKIVALAGLVILFAPAAWADDGALPPGAPCEGTLCDWYHSTHSDTASAPATVGGATAVTAPSGGPLSWFGRSSGPKNAQPAEEPSASNSYMSMSGGGLIGGSKERCTGTLCDAYYGSSPAPSAQAPAGQQQTAASAEPRVPYHRVVHESETRPKCSSPAADPWRCFR